VKGGDKRRLNSKLEESIQGGGKIMKKVFFLCFVCIVFGFVAVYSGHCENMIVGGQVVDESGFRVTEDSEIEALAAPGSINFDEMAPCGFLMTGPVRPTYYKRFGFTINGPDANSGGAVLNDCANFGVTGYSSDNFLAFNCGAPLATGGFPFLPEKIIFTTAVRGVSLKIGSGIGVGETIALTAKTETGRIVDSEIVPLASAMVTVNLTSARANIKRLLITLPEGSNACAFVIDDITTTP
jgi:hypothetical protein